VPSLSGDYEHREADQADRDVASRRTVLRTVLTFAQKRSLGAVAFVELTEMLGLDQELTELSGSPTEHYARHLAIAEARYTVGLSVDELTDREAGNTG
jgi:hypothetical protein